MYFLYFLWPFSVGLVVLLWLLINAILLIWKRTRFGLRFVFVNFTIAALMLGYAKWISGQYYWQLDAVKAVLAEHPEIEQYYVAGNDDVSYEAEVVFCSIGGEQFQIQIPHAAGKSEIRRLIRQALLEKKQ